MAYLSSIPTKNIDPPIHINSSQSSSSSSSTSNNDNRQYIHDKDEIADHFKTPEIPEHYGPNTSKIRIRYFAHPVGCYIVQDSPQPRIAEHYGHIEAIDPHEIAVEESKMAQSRIVLACLTFIIPIFLYLKLKFWDL